MVATEPRLKPDEISMVLGDTRRIERYVLRDLTRTLFPYTKGEQVTVSRFYLLRTPQVIVDYEPPRVLGKMFVEQKRRWAHAHGIVYVPIFLRERLNASQFAARLKDETEAMQAGKVATAERAPVTERTMADPVATALVEQEALARLAALELDRGRTYHGMVRQKFLRDLRQDVERELRSKAHDGGLGYELRAREFSVAAR